ARRSAASSGRGSRPRAASRTSATAPSGRRRPSLCPLSSPNHLLPSDRARTKGGLGEEAMRRSSGPNAPREGFRPQRGLLPVSGDGLCDNLQLGWNGLLGFVQLLDDTSDLRRVDVDSGAHRARERDLLDVAPLGGRRLRPDDLVDHGGVVLDERALLEAPLADRDVDVRAAVGAVLELARLRVVARLPLVAG